MTDSFHLRSTLTRVKLSAIFAATALLFGASTAALALIQSAAVDSNTAAIQGTVKNAAGKPVGDAAITIASGDGQKILRTHTNADGAFAFSGLPSGRYNLSAEKSGLHSRSTGVLNLQAADRKHVDLVLDGEPSAASSMNSNAMSLSDEPNFTVAGVTDWTAVGGHGSDSILRTSEDLARETVALKAQNGGNRTPAAVNDADETKLRAALAGAPGTFMANHQLGQFYLQAGRYQEALPLLEAAYRLDPANRENERDLTRAYESTGDLTQAREHITNLLQRGGNDADVHRMAGEIDEKLNDPLAAVKEYQQAVSLQPTEQNYFAWGSELLLHRAVWQAAEVFRAGIKAHPESARLLTGLGSALFAGASYDDAARSLCRASDLEPGNSELYVFMGKIEMAAPAPLPCVEPRLARFAQRSPDNSLANYLYAMAIWKRQELSANPAAMQQVTTLLNKAVSLDAKCSDGYLQLGILAASEHDYDKAIPLYTKAIDIDPQLAEAHYRLGVAYDRLGERDKAQQEFQLHDQIQKTQASAIEQQRRDVKQFVVVQGEPAKSIAQ